MYPVLYSTTCYGQVTRPHVPVPVPSTSRRDPCGELLVSTGKVCRYLSTHDKPKSTREFHISGSIPGGTKGPVHRRIKNTPILQWRLRYRYTVVQMWNGRSSDSTVSYTSDGTSGTRKVSPYRVSTTPSLRKPLYSTCPKRHPGDPRVETPERDTSSRVGATSLWRPKRRGPGP